MIECLNVRMKEMNDVVADQLEKSFTKGNGQYLTWQICDLSFKIIKSWILTSDITGGSFKDRIKSDQGLRNGTKNS